MKALLYALVLASTPAQPWSIKDVQSHRQGDVTILHEVAVKGDQRVELDVARFDAATSTLRVLDNADGKRGLPAAMAGAGCVAGVNGGYFHPDRTALGLVVADGRELHPLERNALLTGLFTVSRAGFKILRVEEFKGQPRPLQARQAGPFLVDHGALVPGLEAMRSARRTAILADGKGAGALVASDALPLAEFARLLGTPGLVPGLKVERALNLDGGSSTMFYAADPPTLRPGLAEVRDYVGVLPRRAKKR